MPSVPSGLGSKPGLHGGPSEGELPYVSPCSGLATVSSPAAAAPASTPAPASGSGPTLSDQLPGAAVVRGSQGDRQLLSRPQGGLRLMETHPEAGPGS